MEADSDSSNILLSSPGGSHLLSETFTSQTGIASNDLSISELSLTGQPFLTEKSFSLLAPKPPVRDPSLNDNEDQPPQGERCYVRIEEAQIAQQSREDKLQNDIFILRKMNTSFALLNNALDEAEAANQRTVLQLEQTDALLNKYIDILSTSDEIARLILDGDWHGADRDEEILEHERLETERRAAEEREIAARLEEQRRYREELREMEEKRRAETELKERDRSMARGAAVGTRARAAARGTRGVSRAAVTGSSTRGRPTSTSQSSSSRSQGTRISASRGRGG